MAKTIALIGTLDSKGDQVEYLRQGIESRGCRSIVIDVGVLGKPKCDAHITNHQVAEAAGMTIDDIIAMGEKGQEIKSMNKMAEGCRPIIKDLNDKEKIDGLLAVGGTMGTALALDVIDLLPLLFPKMILSTIAYSPGINPDYYSHNVIMIPWIGGLMGFNDVSRKILNQVIAQITAATEVYERIPLSSKPLIGMTALGMTASMYHSYLRPALEKRGFEISVFHATGMQPRFLEKAVSDGSIALTIDFLTGHELIMEVLGSGYSPGPQRLEAAIKKGTPMIVSQGILELASWPSYFPLKGKLADRPHLEHNNLLWMLFTTKEDKLEAAKILSEKLNRATGPTAVVLPLKPFASVSQYGIEDPEGDRLFREELKGNLKPGIKVVEVDATQEDAEFSEQIVNLVDEMVPQSH